MPEFTNVPDMHLWSQSIGGLFINFGCLEFQSFRWIQILGGESAAIGSRKLGLSRRIDKALSLLPGSSIPAESQKLARELWKEVKNLSGTRNRIAHNPLSLGTDPVTKQMRFSVVDLKRMTPTGENMLEPLYYQAIVASALRARDINRLLSQVIETHLNHVSIPQLP